MTFEQWLLSGTLFLAFISAVPWIAKFFHLGWRYRLGRWFAALHSLWAREFAFRRRDSSSVAPRERLRWATRRTFWRPVRFLSRLAHSKFRVTLIVDTLALHRWGVESLENPDEKAERRTALAYREMIYRMAAREKKRLHRKIRCSVCGIKPDHLICSNECQDADHPNQAPHACPDHISDVLPPYVPPSDTESAVKELVNRLTRENSLS